MIAIRMTIKHVIMNLLKNISVTLLCEKGTLAPNFE